MKRPMLWIAGTLVVLLAGCSLNQEFLKTTDEMWSIVGPEYAAYVQADANLDDAQKRVRVRQVEIYTDTLKELLDE
jgi:hypothetical protein